MRERKQVRMMALMNSTITQRTPVNRMNRFIQEEIKVAFYLHKLQFGTPSGLILGLEKYRLLNETDVPADQKSVEAFRQIKEFGILVDASSPKRVSFF